MSAPKKARIEERVTDDDAAPERPGEATDLGAQDNQEYYDEAYAKEEEEEEIADQAAQAEAYDELEALQRQLMEVSGRLMLLVATCNNIASGSKDLLNAKSCTPPQVNDEASDKVLQIEVEYNQKRQPIYRERSKYFKRLPHFWMRVLTQQSNLHELIVGEDIDALCYCEDVCSLAAMPALCFPLLRQGLHVGSNKSKMAACMACSCMQESAVTARGKAQHCAWVQVVVEDAPDIKSGYSIIFHFGENPYFSNATLEKHYAYHDDGTAEITSAAPDWYPGHVSGSFSGRRLDIPDSRHMPDCEADPHACPERPLHVRCRCTYKAHNAGFRVQY